MQEKNVCNWTYSWTIIYLKSEAVLYEAAVGPYVLWARVPVKVEVDGVVENSNPTRRDRRVDGGIAVQGLVLAHFFLLVLGWASG